MVAPVDCNPLLFLLCRGDWISDVVIISVVVSVDGNCVDNGICDAEPEAEEVDAMSSAAPAITACSNLGSDKGGTPMERGTLLLIR